MEKTWCRCRRSCVSSIFIADPTAESDPAVLQVRLVATRRDIKQVRQVDRSTPASSICAETAQDAAEAKRHERLGWSSTWRHGCAWWTLRHPSASAVRTWGPARCSRQPTAITTISSKDRAGTPHFAGNNVDNDAAPRSFRDAVDHLRRSGAARQTLEALQNHPANQRARWRRRRLSRAHQGDGKFYRLHAATQDLIVPITGDTGLLQLANVQGRWLHLEENILTIPDDVGGPATASSRRSASSRQRW